MAEVNERRLCVLAPEKPEGKRSIEMVGHPKNRFSNARVPSGVLKEAGKLQVVGRSCGQIMCRYDDFQ